jgi:transglutaminase-like putative cysteine protease
MRKIITVFLLLGVCCQPVIAQSKWLYSLANVPEAIKTKAAVITHLNNSVFEVEDIDKATLSVHKIFTVTNEDGKYALLFNEYTSKYVVLDDAEIKTYDLNGKQTARYKKKDMRTVATGEGLIEDGYVTYYQITPLSYPITVEIKYDIKIKSTLSIPDYRFIRANESVLESSFTATVPIDLPLRFKPEHTSIQPEISENGKYKTYKWTVKNQPPVEYEEGSASGSGKYPHVKIVTEKFSHYGSQGDLTSWKSFGSWIRDLYQGLDVLPADREQFFASLVKDSETEKEKIKRIYTYMQQNFRYVSIQLGIGGLKPFSADFTDKKKYGDCKALSNYMKAALKAVGIQSHVAIINAAYDQEPVDPGFPSNDFNHVILCVPGQKDSTWLECTSSTSEFGELGTFTENRNALLITDNGGVLVPTPRSHASSNVISTTTSVRIMDDQSGLTETLFRSKGEYKEMMNDILKEKKDDQKETIVSFFGFKNPDDFIMSKDESQSGSVVKLKMAIPKIPEFSSGNKLFINARVYSMCPHALPKFEKRNLDYYFRYPFEKSDTTIYKLIPGMKPDALPKEKELKCTYATYQSKCWYDEKENSIYSTAKLVLNNHKIPPVAYTEVKTFFDNVMQNDTQKIIVLKPDTQKKAF